MQHLTHYHKAVTFNFPNGAAGDALVQSVPLVGSGEILHIRQINKDNVGNRTAQITLENKYGWTFWDGTAKADNTTTDHEFTNRRALCGDDNLKCTLSGDPGAGGAKVDVILTLYGRDA